MTSPENTIGFIVAVERYGLGDDWNLKGVAAQAVQLIHTLYDRGVRRLIVCLSSLAEQADCLKDIPSNIRDCMIHAPGGQYAHPATHDGFHDAIRTLRDEAQRLDAGQRNCLLFFWIGHGNADLKGQRRLLYANAAAGDYSNVAIDEILALLHMQRFSALSEQVFFFDACAGYPTQITAEYADPDALVSKADLPAMATHQNRVYGAPAGKYVEIDAAGGVFTRELMAQLDGITIGGWFPELLSPLMGALVARMKDLKRDVPVVMWYLQDQATEEMILDPTQDWNNALCKLLEQACEDSKQAECKTIRNTYLAEYRRFYRLTDGISLAQLLQTIAQPFQNRDGRIPLLDFAEGLAAELNASDALVARIKEQINGLGVERGFTMDQLDRLRAGRERARDVILALLLAPFDGGYHIRAWRRVFGGAYRPLEPTAEKSRDEIKAFLPGHIQTLLTQAITQRPLRFRMDVYLPLDLLSELPVDEWKVRDPKSLSNTESFLGCQRYVVFRAYERLDPNYRDDLRPRWESRWRRGLKEDYDGQIVWYDRDDLDAFYAAIAYTEDPAALRTRLAVPFLLTSDHWKGILDAGIPVVVCPRVRGGFSQEDIPQLFEAAWESVPAKGYDWRNHYLAARGQYPSLTLFWDSPDDTIPYP